MVSFHSRGRLDLEDNIFQASKNGEPQKISDVKGMARADPPGNGVQRMARSQGWLWPQEVLIGDEN